jgi:nucleoid-associated protein YgaU
MFVGLAVILIVVIYFATKKSNSVEERAVENTTLLTEPNLLVAEVNAPPFDANGTSLPVSGSFDSNTSALPATQADSSTATAPAADSTLFEQSEPVKTSKFYVVRKGDTLSSISQKYYHNTKGINKIYEANRGVMKSKNSLRVGMKLTIPE